MIAILRVRFDSNNDANSVWSNDVFEKWMQPLIPFSLGDFWWSSSKGLFSLEHTVYAPIVMADPGHGTLAQRQGLVDATITAATAQVSPDWDNTDIVMIWYAQPTDLFGGGFGTVPLRAGGSKNIPVTVIDIAAPFDAACQELGHSFGLQHEVDAQFDPAHPVGEHEYKSPYSVMSARGAEFIRPFDARLPDGMRIADPTDRQYPQLAGRIIGPALAAAQLYQNAAFRNTPQVMNLPGSYAQNPPTVRLYALNYTVRVPPGPLPVLAAFPSNVGDGRIFTVELRRGGFGYDAAIGTPGWPVAGLVVHSINPDGRIRYEGVAPLTLAATHTDWHCKAGNFSLRLRNVGAGNEFADFAAFGGVEWPLPPTLKQVFSGGDGIIYAVMDNGDLNWYRHDGWSDGSFEWADKNARKVGTGWNVKRIFSGGGGVIYAITDTGDLLWYRHDGRGDGSFKWTGVRKVGVGWNFKKVFSGGDGVIYAITDTGDLLWYRHDGRGDGSVKWADNHGRKVGAGWNFKKVFSGGDGVIYAIADNGDLLWYRHDGRGDGSVKWADNHGRKVGSGWNMKEVFSGGDGVIYAIADSGDLLWFHHDGRNDGSFKWADKNARKVGTGWRFSRVIYAILDNGDLLWFRHDGRGDGRFVWATDAGRKVGNGWNVKQVFSGGDGVIYAVMDNGDLLWNRHDGRGVGKFVWATDTGRKVGNCWNVKQAFSGGDGVIYAVMENGDLLWNRHDGRGDGSFKWATDTGRKVGNGWNARQVFSGGDGIIYALMNNGDLLWNRHDGRGDGSFVWATDTGRKVGSGWNVKQVFSG
jgi:hypothetical protein